MDGGGVAPDCTWQMSLLGSRDQSARDGFIQTWKPTTTAASNKATEMINRSPVGVLSHTRRTPCATAGDGGTELPGGHELRSIKLATYSC